MSEGIDRAKFQIFLQRIGYVYDTERVEYCTAAVITPITHYGKSRWCKELTRCLGEPVLSVVMLQY